MQRQTLSTPIPVETLTTAERNELRERLAAYAELHALPTPSRRSWLSTTWRSRFSVPYAVTAFVGLLLVGSSAVYASENALPGDPLYPVKVDVREPIAGALTPPGPQKARYEAARADTRLKEAATLAASHRLDAQTTVALRQRYVQSLDAAEKQADTLAATGHADASSRIRTDLRERFGGRRPAVLESDDEHGWDRPALGSAASSTAATSTATSSVRIQEN